MSGYNIKAIDAELECLNERIADRNATIASQAAEIERLRECIKSLNAIIAKHIGDEATAALQPKEGVG
jgi:peptidoglycan hydrolase CwlO-like protein